MVGRIIRAGIVNKFPQLLSAITHSVPRGPRPHCPRDLVSTPPGTLGCPCDLSRSSSRRETLRSGSGRLQKGEAVWAEGATEDGIFLYHSFLLSQAVLLYQEGYQQLWGSTCCLTDVREERGGNRIVKQDTFSSPRTTDISPLVICPPVNPLS